MGIEEDILQVLDSRRGEFMRAADIAAQLGKEVTVIEGYIDRLEQNGEVSASRTFGGYDALITPLGVVRVYEQTRARPRLYGPRSQPEEARTPREQAAALLGEAAAALETETAATEKALMQMMRAAYLLQREEMYLGLFRELNGYPADAALPWWRDVYATRQYVGDKVADTAAIVAEYPAGLPPQREVYGLREPLHVVARNADAGMSLSARPAGPATIGGRQVNLVEVQSVLPKQLQNVLGCARQHYYAEAVAALAELEFGDVALSVFEGYVSQLDAKLGRLGLADSLRVATENLRPGDEESCRQTVFAVRHAVTALSRRLWRATCAQYAPLGLDLQGRPGVELVKNKLRAWLHQRGLRRHGEGLIEQELVWLADLANALWDFDSKTAKGSVTYEDARTCLIATYVFLGEIAVRTDLEPVTDETLNA